MQENNDVIRVYMDGCFDLMHFGHANALRQARAIASQINDKKKCELIVGLVSDEEILRCKGPPVLPEAERVKCVKAVKWVDDVITNVPYELLPEFVGELFSGASLIVCSLFLSNYMSEGFDETDPFSLSLSPFLLFYDARQRNTASIASCTATTRATYRTGRTRTRYRRSWASIGRLRGRKACRRQI
jgi:cytidyltransferase-like protein